MKKILIIACVVLLSAFKVNAQRVGYIDTDRILSAIPEYKVAQDKLEELSKQYSSKIESEFNKIEALYQTYQAQKANMSQQVRQQKENEIIQKEKAAKELQKSYFGQDGTMQKKSEELLNPIKEKVNKAIEKLGNGGQFMILFDIAAMQGVAYINEDDDLSNQVIKMLGY